MQIGTGKILTARLLLPLGWALPIIAFGLLFSILELKHLKVRRDALEIVNRFLITEQLHTYGSRYIWCFVIAITSCPIVTELGRLAIQSFLLGSKILFGINAWASTKLQLCCYDLSRRTNYLWSVKKNELSFNGIISKAVQLLELRPYDASVGFLTVHFPLQLQMKSVTALADETTLNLNWFWHSVSFIVVLPPQIFLWKGWRKTFLFSIYRRRPMSLEFFKSMILTYGITKPTCTLNWQLVMQGSPLLSQLSFCDQPLITTSYANEEGEIGSTIWKE